jgi:hypothetical protein
MNVNHQQFVGEKYTRGVIDWMSKARDADESEFIIRLKDAHGIERPMTRSPQDAEALQRAEQDEAHQLMEGLIDYIHRLEQERPGVRLLDSSWLTHSVLVRATPRMVRLIGRRNDVDLIDLNSEITKAF